MSWLLPSALGIAAVAAVAITLLHFIARSRPLAEPLPTARFIPDRPVHARTRSLALSDLVLLLMRVAAIAAIGIAVAAPVLSPGKRVTRVFLLDRSRAVASVAEARDSVRGLAQPGDVVVPFDSSAARVVELGVLDSISEVSARGSLSAALASGIRTAARLSTTADSIELVLVSPVVAEELDGATLRLRATWPGRIRLVPVAARVARRARPTIALPDLPDDAIVVGLAAIGSVAPRTAVTPSEKAVIPSEKAVIPSEKAVIPSEARDLLFPVRVIRGTVTSADSLWASDSGHVLLHWPATDADAHWPRRATIDAIGGVSARGATLVARFPRLWRLDGTAVARWADGEPAAVEHAMGSGCIRDVGIVIDPAGDLTLRTPFRWFASALVEPCGGSRDFAAADSSVRASLIGHGALPSSTELRDPATTASKWTPWLLALAALLLTGELAFRRPERAAA